MTAGRRKADLVAALLVSLGCANVRVEHSVGYAPGSSRVAFQPTPEVAGWLRETW